MPIGIWHGSKIYKSADIGLSLSLNNFVAELKKNKMNSQTIEEFTVIGISVRTTNENGQSGKDIGELWNKFMMEKVLEQIPNKLGGSVYCIYTDYESDYMKPYTTIIGCKVKDLSTIPNGMIGKTIKSGNYSKHLAKGNILQEIVVQVWMDIWHLNLKRLYTADFEVYGDKAHNPENAEVEIFVAIK
jgi:predicted transcriptional regulator YdeE